MFVLKTFFLNVSFLLIRLEKQKNQLIEALAKKGQAICTLLTAESASGTEVTSTSDLPKLEEADASYFELVKVSGSESGLYENAKVASFLEKHATVRKNYGRVIKTYLKQAEGAGNGKSGLEADNKLVVAFNNAGWTHAATFYERTMHVRYPKAYRLF